MAQLRDLVGAGLPPSLPAPDRAALRLAALASSAAPRPVAAIVRRRIRAETRGVIIPAADPAFRRHVRDRRDAGFAVNVNLLGEAILGDDEAQARLDALCARMRRPDVDYVSVKISALCANLDVLAFEHEVERIAARLEVVYDVAAESQPPVFVNLDMEEYRDLHLTVAAFRHVLDEPRFTSLPAGIVLQAYLPDTHDVARRAAGVGRRPTPRRRRAGQGAPRQGCQPGDGAGRRRARRLDPGAVRHQGRRRRQLQGAARPAARRRGSTAGCVVGVGSHNLFDVAWALGERDRRGLDDVVGIEMLEGMAPPQSRATRDDAGGLLLYTPVVTDEDFAASIAYLSRRLDENAAPENFLRSLFTITPDSPIVARRARALRDRRRRQRDRVAPAAPGPGSAHRAAPLRSRRAVRQRARHRLHAGRQPGVDPRAPRHGPPGRAAAAHHDDGRHRRGRRTGHATAPRGGRRRRRSSAARALARVAEVMAADRGRTLAVMAHETGKTVREGDPEVSEAIDFAMWAAACTRELDDLAADGVAADPLGVVLVAGPWNFPTAIPANGVVAALAAGNAVILKPAPEAVATAVELVRHVHEAGVPADVVQLVRCPDDDVGRHLVTHAGVDGVVLTGSYDTARLFLGWRPDLRLLAETSGKNALVDQPDGRRRRRPARPRPLGVRPRRPEVLGGEPGDRRGAAVRRRRRSGAASPTPCAASASARRPTWRRWSARSSPSRRARWPARSTTLDDGERWLVEPRRLDDAPVVARRPARRASGSWFHRTECFGPVLGVMRADDLDHAIELQNAVDYGLTGGLHSLDESEIERWLERVEVGNVYVNRHTTGAIVRRQPFGGWKRSSVGRGAKTGGPDDINRFVTFRLVDAPRKPAAESYRAVVGGSLRSPDRPHGPAQRDERAALPAGSGGDRRVLPPTRPTRTSPRCATRLPSPACPWRCPTSRPTTSWRRASRATGIERLRVLTPDRRRAARRVPRRRASPSTRHRSPTTGGSSCRAGCASRRSRGPATATGGSRRHNTRTRAMTCISSRAATMPPVMRWRRWAERRPRASWRRKPMPTITTTATTAPTVPATRSPPPCVWRTISSPATHAASAVRQYARAVRSNCSPRSPRSSLTRVPPR